MRFLWRMRIFSDGMRRRLCWRAAKAGNAVHLLERNARMLKSGKFSFVLMALIFALLLTGCGYTSDFGGAPENTGSKVPTKAPVSEHPSEAPKEATWIVDISDTQQITDEMGLIWNYSLMLHASKPGGVDATGDYSGEAILSIEPDMASAQALAAAEGTQLIAMLFNYHAECENLSFTIIPFVPDKYAELMEQYNPDNPLARLNPGDSSDFFAIISAVFSATQEPISMTLSGDKGTISGTVPGRAATVDVPTEISIDGASAYCFFYNTPHPLARAFKGTITGDVL